jgi:hypothetical protein
VPGERLFALALGRYNRPGPIAQFVVFLHFSYAARVTTSARGWPTFDNHTQLLAVTTQLALRNFTCLDLKSASSLATVTPVLLAASTSLCRFCTRSRRQ